MTATVDTEVWTGGSSGSPNKTTTSTARFRTDDSPTTTDTTNPVPIPDAGTNYSYWMHVALTISGTYTEVSNIRLYTDGTLGWTVGTGGDVNLGNQDSGDLGCPEASYEPATGTTGDTGDDLGSNHTYYSGETSSEVSAFSYTSGSPATIDSNSYSADGSTYAAVMQLDVDTDASSGTQSDETFTFLYDEI